MLGFSRIALFKDLAKTLLHQVWVIFKNFSANCRFRQQMSGELISFSMIRPIVFVIQFTKGRNLLQQELSSYLLIPKICPSLVNHWQTLQQNYRTCYKQIRWPHTSNILDVIFHWISAAYFWLQNFNKKLIKERNLLQIFVKEHCFEKKCFDNKKCKEFSSVKDQPMFRNMIKTICCLARTKNMKFNRCCSKVCTE